MYLPVNHPTRIVNILFGSLFIVVVPFVYYCIFRYNEDSNDDHFYDDKVEMLGRDVFKTSVWVPLSAKLSSNVGGRETWSDEEIYLVISYFTSSLLRLAQHAICPSGL